MSSKSHCYDQFMLQVNYCGNLRSVLWISVEPMQCAGFLKARETTPLGDLTSSLFPQWEKQHSSDSWSFWLCMRPLSTRARVHWLVLRGRVLKKGIRLFKGSLWRGDGDQAGRVADAPVSLSSQNVRPSVFFFFLMISVNVFSSSVMLA